MTLAREANTFPRAVSKIAELLGYPHMASIVGRSERLVRKWSHPAANAHPTLAQGVALDAAYVEAGGDCGPIAETYLALLDRRIGEHATSRAALAAAIADLARESGEAVSSMIIVAHSNGDPRAIQHAQTQLEEAQSSMAVVGRRLSSFHNSGAGPELEALGGSL